MRHVDDLGLDEYLAAIAVSRIVLGPKARVQAPPNLVDLDECRALLGSEQPESEPAESPAQEPAEESKPTIACPQCQTPMECISHVKRPGWNRVLNGPDRPGWYDPFGHALAWDCRRSYREPPDG